MNSSLMKVVVSTLWLGSVAHALAVPLIPSTGSAYISCSPSTCQTLPTPASDLAAPISGYVLVSSLNRVLTMNNGYTGFTNVNIGTVLDVVWRKAAAAAPVTATPMCIYGTKVTMTMSDYDIATSGMQYFDMRDIARGGYSASSSLDVAYSVRSPSSFHPTRIGRTYTSVSAGGLPPFGSSANMHASLADLDSNWVDFTTKAGVTSYPSSAMVYVTAQCSTAAPVAITNAIRVRQTIAPFIEVSTSGFAPP